MTLSILICTLKERYYMLFNLVYGLSLQCGQEICAPAYEITDTSKKITRKFISEVEIITLEDDGQMTTGQKRQMLLESAEGKYIVFVDDDDEVPNYYVVEILEAAKSNADCFAINGIMTTDGYRQMKWYLSKDNPNITVFENGSEVYLRTTNHITGVKRELALQAGFPDKSNAEDKAYLEKLNPLLKTEHTIERPMYHYKFSTQNKKYT